jgi:hypothetical protein
MPVKTRIPKTLRQTFNAGTVDLFYKLERMPRDTQAFKDGSHELARRLNLIDEWWRGEHVNDRSASPCHPPGCMAHGDFYRVRAVREQLLEAARRGREEPPARRGPEPADAPGAARAIFAAPDSKGR